jgi:hypothetical protein
LLEQVAAVVMMEAGEVPEGIVLQLVGKALVEEAPQKLR